MGMARDLVEIFISSGDETLAAIANALDRRDYATVGAQAHSLKGASTSLRAQATTAVAEQLEAAARAGDADQVVALAATMRSEVARTIDYLRAKVAASG